MLFLIILFVGLVVITILSYFLNLFSKQQIGKIWYLALTTLIILVVRNQFIQTDIANITSFVVLWYLLMLFTMNYLERDNDTREQNFAFLVSVRSGFSIAVVSLVYLVFFEILRRILLRREINFDEIVISTVLFIIWYGINII